MEKSKSQLIISIVFRSIAVVFLLIGTLIMIAEEFYVEDIHRSYSWTYLYSCIQLGFITLTLLEISRLVCEILKLASLKKVNHKDDFFDLERLSDLKEKGLITAEEFEEKRKEIVKKI